MTSVTIVSLSTSIIHLLSLIYAGKDVPHPHLVDSDLKCEERYSSH